MDSMEQIYKEHAKTVYRYLLSLTHNEDLAEEITQETFYQAVRCAGKYDGSCKISTWLCAIAKNSWLAWMKKNKEIVISDDKIEEDTVCSAEDMVISDISKVELMRKLHQLKEPLREVIYLRLAGDLSFREIGDIMGMSENWARVNYFRGKEKLLKEVKKDE
ncbi:RNA polymerase sigma factor [Anaerocolumna aminovalerica]|uniref:RNA polymerase sigma-70 factor, ECF subfamily n=2 Tax=Anaerocolumna aminovalerica TaxID=1527 RepID=A0A1I5DRJ4_9FIRM|nr:sigma-70 family RNA polymerase sigma factor [Anaerocolumna aminovalerica]SFO01700.1 RNA polymerase sigma-70 factor, ECF subfamily [Anaerocolumna aminovalerica]